MNLNTFLEMLFFNRTDSELGFIFKNAFLLLNSTEKVLFLHQLKTGLNEQKRDVLIKDIISLHDFLFKEEVSK